MINKYIKCQIYIIYTYVCFYDYIYVLILNTWLYFVHNSRICVGHNINSLYIQIFKDAYESER